MTERAQMNSMNNDSGIFTEKDWNELINRLAILFNFTEEKKQRFMENRLAKLIAAIPYIAKSESPNRMALAHLTITYLASHEAGKDLFLHNFTDNKSLMKRLEPISHFSGGNKDIIQRGMNLLAVIMLSDHLKDKAIDKKVGKYNPVSSGIWNYNDLIQKLGNDIHSVDCPAMDDIISFEDAKAAWWEFY